MVILIFAYSFYACLERPVWKNHVFLVRVAHPHAKICLCRSHRKIKIWKKIKFQIIGNPNPRSGHPAATAAKSGRGTAAAARSGQGAAAAAGSGHGEGAAAPGRLARASGGEKVERPAHENWFFCAGDDPALVPPFFSCGSTYEPHGNKMRRRLGKSMIQCLVLWQRTHTSAKRNH